jgi:hypothetical protein
MTKIATIGMTTTSATSRAALVAAPVRVRRGSIDGAVPERVLEDKLSALADAGVDLL